MSSWSPTHLVAGVPPLGASPEEGEIIRFSGGIWVPKPIEDLGFLSGHWMARAHNVPINGTDATASLVSLIAVASAAPYRGGKLIFTPAEYTFKTATTIGSAILDVVVEPGAVLVADNCVVTFGTRNIVADRTSIFITIGTGEFRVAGGTRVFPEWWEVGAFGSVLQADMNKTWEAFKKAMHAGNSEGVIVDFDTQPGSDAYMIGNKDASGFWLAMNQPNIAFEGHGKSSRLRLAPNMLSTLGSDIDIFRVLGGHPGYSWKNFLFDGNGAANPLPVGTGGVNPNMFGTLINCPAATAPEIDIWAENHVGAHVIGLGSDVAGTLANVTDPTVRLRAKNCAIDANAYDVSLVWAKSRGGTFVVTLDNDLMAGVACPIELHGSYQSMPLLMARNCRHAFLLGAENDHCDNVHIGTIICDNVLNGSAVYGSNIIGQEKDFRIGLHIDRIIGTQIGNTFPFIDFAPITFGTAPNSEVSIDEVFVRHLGPATGTAAHALRVTGKFDGRIHIGRLVGVDLPCSLIHVGPGIVTPVGAPPNNGALELIVDDYHAIDCGKTSDLAAMLHVAVSIGDPAQVETTPRIQRLALGRGRLTNTAGADTPLAGWIHSYDASFTDLDIGKLDCGSVPLTIFFSSTSYTRWKAYDVEGEPSAALIIPGHPQSSFIGPPGSRVRTSRGLFIKRSIVTSDQGWVLHDEGAAVPDAGEGLFRSTGSFRLDTGYTVAGGAGVEYVRQGWLTTAAGTPGTQKEVRALTGE